MIVTITIPGKPVPKATMTTALVNKALADWCTPKSKAEATKLQRIRDTLAYQETVAWMCKGKPMLQGYIQMTLRIYLNPVKGKLPEDRGDIDNYHKSVTDGLQYGGIFAPSGKRKKGNDKTVIRYGAGAGIYLTDEQERAEIVLEEIEL